MNNPEKLAIFGTQGTRRRKYRETGNIWYTRHTTKTIQRNWQHLVHKAHDEDNTEKLATFGTQGTQRRQYRKN